MSRFGLALSTCLSYASSPVAYHDFKFALSSIAYHQIYSNNSD